MAALRMNQGKPRLSFVLRMPRALNALSRVFEQGAIKYAPNNWLKGGKPDEEYIDSAQRHMLALANGETYDPDTGCLHAAHVIWNMGALIELNTLGGLADLPDLDPTFDQAAFEARYTDKVPEHPSQGTQAPASEAGYWSGEIVDGVYTSRFVRSTVDL